MTAVIGKSQYRSAALMLPVRSSDVVGTTREVKQFEQPGAVLKEPAVVAVPRAGEVHVQYPVDPAGAWSHDGDPVAQVERLVDVVRLPE
jgi:hypothetical protein